MSYDTTPSDEEGEGHYSVPRLEGGVTMSHNESYNVHRQRTPANEYTYAEPRDQT